MSFLQDWLVLAGILIPVCFSSNVRFFEERNFKGYMYETIARPHYCERFPEYIVETLGSVNITDCVVISPTLDCSDESSYVIRSNVSNLATIVANSSIKSYRGCSGTEKGTDLDVVISEPHPEHTRLEFKKVCTCTNLPKLLRSLPLTATSGGKCVHYYADEDCKGTPQIWGNLGYLGDFNAKEIGSFKPCNFLANCLRMDAVITKFEPANEDEDFQNFTIKVPLAASEIFCNNGEQKVTGHYSAEKPIEENFKFEFAEEFNKLNSLCFDAGSKIKSVASFPESMKSALFDIQNGLIKYQSSSGWTEGNTFKLKRTTKFAASKEISLTPHTYVKASSFVEVVNNAHVNYNVEFKLSGMMKSGRKLTAEEIRGHLRNLKFVRDLDDFTVLVETTAQLKATFGLEVVVVTLSTTVNTVSTSNPEKRRIKTICSDQAL